MRSKVTLVLAGWLAFTAAVGCYESSKAPEAPASSLSGAARASIESALKAYEGIRAALAQDRANVRGPALQLAGAATVALGAAPPALRPQLEDLSSSAQKLATMMTEDVAEVRKTFGQVSESVVALLAAEPSLQKGRHLFECPMAEGYKKWVQLGETVSNPYMGSRMLECGATAAY